MSAELDALKAEISHNGDVVLSAVALIHGLADAAHAAKDDPAAIAELTAKIKASADALGAAVAENTVAAPAPAPVVEPAPVVVEPVPAPAPDAPSA